MKGRVFQIFVAICPQATQNSRQYLLFRTRYFVGCLWRWRRSLRRLKMGEKEFLLRRRQCSRVVRALDCSDRQLDLFWIILSSILYHAYKQPQATGLPQVSSIWSAPIASVLEILPIINNGNLFIYLFFSCANCRRHSYPKPGDHLIIAAFEMFIGSLKIVVDVVQNRHAGNQATHRHKTNKELTSSEFPLFVFSQ